MPSESLDDPLDDTKHASHSLKSSHADTLTPPTLQYL